MTDSLTDPDDPRPIALITGGGTGIGAAIARRLARDGFEVVVAGRRRDRLDAVVARVTDAQGVARAVVMDVTDAASVEAGVAGLDRLDVLVNNAGGALGVNRVEDGDLEQWQQMYATNVLGSVRVIQAALPLLRQSSRATIVDISSIAGERVYEGGGGPPSTARRSSPRRSGSSSTARTSGSSTSGRAWCTPRSSP